MQTEIKLNSLVEYKLPFSDEIGLTFIVIEIQDFCNWAKIQANVNMDIKPTYTANISDLKLVQL